MTRWIRAALLALVLAAAPHAVRVPAAAQDTAATAAPAQAPSADFSHRLRRSADQPTRPGAWRQSWPFILGFAAAWLLLLAYALRLGRRLRRLEERVAQASASIPVADPSPPPPSAGPPQPVTTEREA